MLQSLGAPTVLAILVILRVEKRLDALTKAIIALPIDIAAHVNCPFRSNPKPPPVEP